MNNFRVLIYGLPGSGKSTYCAKRIIKALSEGYVVFTNIKIEFEGHTTLGVSNSKFLKKLVHFIIKRLEHKIIKLSNREIHIQYPTIQKTREKLRISRDILYLEKWIENLEVLTKVQFYDVKNYVLTQNFDEVIESIKKMPIKQKKVVIWDEGFIDFSHQNSPSSSFAEFFNQGRHFNCDLIIASQRAVAVFPTFRALCDYSLECQRKFGWIQIRKYYLDSSTSLPASDEGKLYDFFKISNYSMFFNTVQRFI
jgi:adenylate kinase family enzyme